MRLNVVCFHQCQGEFDLKLDIVDTGSVLAHPKTMPKFQQYVTDWWFFPFDHFLQSCLRQIGDKAVMTMLCKKIYCLELSQFDRLWFYDTMPHQCFQVVKCVAHPICIIYKSRGWIADALMLVDIQRLHCSRSAWDRINVVKQYNRIFLCVTY